MLSELLRHPVLGLRFILGRIRAIPTKGLPNWRARKHDDFDRKYGVETARFVRVTTTNSPNRSHGRKYEPATEDTIRWCIENCGMAHSETTFVDIGSGKGRVLIVAAEYGFRRIIGVEYSPVLASACRRNLEKLNLLSRCETVVEDAADFRFPDGDLLVFLYNPFDEVILRRVLEKLAVGPGKVRLAQSGPGHDVIQSSGVAQEVCAGAGAAIYEIGQTGRQWRTAHASS